MIKTLSKAQKMEREKFRIPRSVQDAIPIRRMWISKDSLTMSITESC